MTQKIFYCPELDLLILWIARENGNNELIVDTSEYNEDDLLYKELIFIGNL